MKYRNTERQEQTTLSIGISISAASTKGLKFLCVRFHSGLNLKLSMNVSNSSVQFLCLQWFDILLCSVHAAVTIVNRSKYNFVWHGCMWYKILSWYAPMSRHWYPGWSTSTCTSLYYNTDIVGLKRISSHLSQKQIFDFGHRMRIPIISVLIDARTSSKQNESSFLKYIHNWTKVS